MKKLIKFIIGIITIIMGWFALGIGFAEPLGGHPYSTIVFMSGFAFIIGGIVIIVLSAKKSNKS